MKKLHWISNAIVNTSVLVIFWLYDGVKIILSTLGLGNILSIAFVRTGQQCNQSPSNIHDGCFDENSYVNLQTLTILAKKLTNMYTTKKQKKK